MDACIRSTEFGILSHLCMIIHSYIQIDLVRVSGGYVHVYDEGASKEHILGAKWLSGKELDWRSRG